MQKLRDHFAQLQSTLPPDGPGFSAVVMQEGEPVFELHHGMSSLELQVPLSGDSAYYLASESKQFTAACVMTMVRQGRIALDGDVCFHLPELARFEQAFPLKSLLNHSSGIPDYFQFIECQLSRHEADYFNNATILQLIARLDSVEFATSTQYGYSNSNYILLATLVERLAGMSIASYARTTLFEPLGMHRLTFDEDRFSILPHRVWSYEPDQSRPCGYKQNLGNANTVGDGGIYGSTSELLRWEREWHRQWNDRTSLLHDMLQPSPLLDGTVSPYRFGLEMTREGDDDVVFHTGCLWGFNSLILRLPQRRMSVVHLANCEPAAPEVQQLLAAVLS